MAQYAIIEGGVVVNMIEADATHATNVGAVLATGSAVGDLYDGEVFTKPVVSLSDLKTAKMLEVNSAFESVITTMKAGYTEDEIKSWDKQENEARAYVLDAGATVPLLTAMATAGGTTVSALVTRVIIKADLWATNYGAELGKKQGLEDAILVAATAHDVAAVSW